MQKKVNLYPVVGLEGQEVAVGTAVYTPQNYISDGTVAAGGFAFASTTTDSGEVFPIASAKGTGTVLGYVERTVIGALSYGEDGTLIYPKGAGITVARRGDYYHVATGEATVGQAVLCNPTTGAVTYGTAGATNDTGWVVMTAATNKGDVIVISNRGVGITPASS